jgi:uncharacterized membrane protein YdjX (TVP38/TMEM64 family)
MRSPAPPPSPTRDTDGVVRHELWLAVVALLVLLAGAWAFGAFLRDEVSALANRVFLELGLTGLAALFLVSETIVSPLPPDAVLLLVAGSDLAAQWQGPVVLLGLMSMLGGHLAWLLGRQLGQTGLIRRLLGHRHGRIVNLTRRYGLWAVVLAAATPLPWSVTSLTAGALHLPYGRFLLGSLPRAPRIVIAYVLIHAAFHGAAPSLGP